MIILFSQPSTSIETGRDHQWLPYPVNTHSPAERERTTRGCMGRRLHCHARVFERCAELDGIQLHAQRSAQWCKQRGSREDGTTEVWHCTHTQICHPFCDTLRWIETDWLEQGDTGRQRSPVPSTPDLSSHRGRQTLGTPSNQCPARPTAHGPAFGAIDCREQYIPTG